MNLKVVGVVLIVFVLGVFFYRDFIVGLFSWFFKLLLFDLAWFWFFLCMYLLFSRPKNRFNKR